MVKIEIKDQEFCEIMNCKSYEIQLVSRGVNGSIDRITRGDIEALLRTDKFRIPMGNPVEQYVTFIHDGDQGILSIFVTKDNAIHGIFEFNPLPSKKLILNAVSPILKSFTDLLKQVKEGNDSCLLKLPSSIKFSRPSPLKINNMSFIIYNLLTKRKIILVGSNEEIINDLLLFNELLPENYYSFNFGINSSELLDQLDIICFNEKGQDELTKLSHDSELISESAILDHRNHQVMGMYDSPLCQSIAMLLEQDISLGVKKIQEIINQSSITTNYSDPETMADEEDISYPDADLLWEIYQKLGMKGE